MKISKKAEYALRAVLAMSRSAPGSLFSITSLSQEERIPLKFLEQILLVLRKGGLLVSRRGAGGGYHLGKPPTRITVGEVIYLVDGPLEIMPGGDVGPASLRTTLLDLQSVMGEWLSSVTLADVLQRENTGASVSFEI